MNGKRQFFECMKGTIHSKAEFGYSERLCLDLLGFNIRNTTLRLVLVGFKHGRNRIALQKSSYLSICPYLSCFIQDSDRKGA